MLPVRGWRKALRRRWTDRGWIVPIESKRKVRARRDVLVNHALGDPHGMGMLSLMMHNAKVEPRSQFLFQNLRKGDVCIDCGMNVGIVSDMMLHMKATVYGFEPHPKLFTFLKQKYEGNDSISLYPQAVWHTPGEMKFHINSNEDEKLLDWSQQASLVAGAGREQFEVEAIDVDVIDLTEWIRAEILPRHGEVYLLKIDIEGAEFELIEKLIETKLYESIRYIVCETHARFVTDGPEKLAHIEALIREHNITNINLEWV
ncbi:MAG: FkbM family methyltransferase [Phycisphaerales bacterium]|jgi:FkbM family methyltransferase|nr:FkbM family methyltransferase [Phycisphaerales bacterium]MBT7171413.1 FkbM family methyltransferase [Phycisphaerales bacterium]